MRLQAFATSFVHLLWNRRPRKGRHTRPPVKVTKSGRAFVQNLSHRFRKTFRKSECCTMFAEHAASNSLRCAASLLPVTHQAKPVLFKSAYSGSFDPWCFRVVVRHSCSKPLGNLLILVMLTLRTPSSILDRQPRPMATCHPLLTPLPFRGGFACQLSATNRSALQQAAA